jgi:hypothetical protein
MSDSRNLWSFYFARLDISFSSLSNMRISVPIEKKVMESKMNLKIRLSSGLSVSKVRLLVFQAS